MESVLVLGAGMLGTFAARGLSEAGAGVLAADLSPRPDFFQRFGPRKAVELRQVNVLDATALRALFGLRPFKAVVLAAGPGSKETTRNPPGARAVYVEGTREVCRAACAAKVRRLVLLSSFASYGSCDRDRISEELPARPRSDYGRLKAAAEDVALEFRDSGLEVRILRLCGVYGPVPVGAGSQAAQLIDSILCCALSGREVRLDPHFGDDEILYVKDAARGITAAALRQPEATESIFNLGAGLRTRIDEICSTVRRLVPGARLRLASSSSRSPARPPLDIRRIREILGFEPSYPLEDGLKDYLREAGFSAS